MPPLLLFLKAYVPEHTRRMKNGNIITVKAYYDKRIKKAAKHAPDHTHDVGHLSDEDKVKFANMHKEQHVSHYYEAHALKRKLDTEHQLRDTLKRSLERYKESGDTKSWTITKRKIEALEARMVIHQKHLARAEKISKGIGEMKEGLVKDSGTLTDDADQAHARYVEKMGERFRANTYQTGRLLPASAAPSYFKAVILNSKEGDIIPNPKFNLGKLSKKATQELSLIIDGADNKQRNIRVSGRTIKHIAEQRPKLAEHIVNNLVAFFADNPEVYPNHQYHDRALLIHQGDAVSGDKHYAAAVEIIIKGDWIDVISIMSMPERTLKKARQLKQEIMDGQQPQNSDSHHHVASKDAHAEADFTGVHDSLGSSIAPLMGKDNALQSAIDHLDAGSKQKDLPVKERAEDKALVDKLKAALGNPESFVTAPDGSFDFGEITPDVAKIIGRESAKIRLRFGDEKSGLTHIEMRHNSDIQALGFSNATDFVHEITKNFTTIYKSDKPNSRSLILVENKGKLKFAGIQLELSNEGGFYEIKNATPGREGQFKNKTPIWESAGPSTSNDKHTLLFPEAKSDTKSIAQPTENASPSDNKALLWEGAQSNQLKEPPSAVSGKSKVSDKSIAPSSEKSSYTDDLNPSSPNYRYRDTGINGHINPDEIKNAITNDAINFRDVPATYEQWLKDFPENRADTPIGKVKLGENQFKKLIANNRGRFIGLIKPTLESPTFIVTNSRGANVYIKAFIKEDGKHRGFMSVSYSIDGIDIVVSSHPKDVKALVNEITTGTLRYRSSLEQDATTFPNGQRPLAGGLDSSIAPSSEKSSYTYAKPSTIDTPAQGELNGAREGKKTALKRVADLRERIKNEPLNGNRTGLRLELIRAQDKLNEYRRAENDALEAIEKRANQLGLTTIKPKSLHKALSLPPKPLLLIFKKAA